MSCKCCCTHGHTAIQEKRNSLLKDYWRIILSTLLLFGSLILNATDATFFKGEYVPFIWYLLAYLSVGLPVMREAWESILQKNVFSEFTLMSIATLGAFYIGEYPEGVAVMLFYSLGELFQDKAVDKAKRNISALLDVRPETATVIRNGSTLVEAPQRVQVGETIEVKAGERVPLDGTMLDEVAAFNTSALTGESVPRNIRQGGEVLAGMIATDKVVRIQVTKPFEKSALSRILELVQNASERKAPAELFIRKFARIYTPAVTGLAALIVLLPFLYSLADAQFSFIFNDWLYRALVFLVISCPCALVVSIPLGYFGGIGAASRLGVLFKGGNYLDAITQVNTVVFDKTGTLTCDQIVLEKYINADGSSDNDKRILRHAYFNSFFQTGLKNLMDKAILSHVKDLDLEHLKDNYKKVDEIPFDFTRRRMSVVVEDKQGKRQIITKGAVEEMLEICSYAEFEGKVQPFKPELKQKAKEISEQMNKQGMRVIAVAQKSYLDKECNFCVKDENEMVLIGYLSLIHI